MVQLANKVPNLPLAEVPPGVWPRLQETLWSHKLCDGCSTNYKAGTCSGGSCASQVSHRLNAYFKYYKSITSTYEPDTGTGVVAALTGHADLLRIVRRLKANPSMHRSMFREELWLCRSKEGKIRKRLPTVADMDRALNLAVKVLTMINCWTTSRHGSYDLLEHGVYSRRWEEGVSLSQFITDSFPKSNHTPLSNVEDPASVSIRASLSAKRLKKHLKLKFQPTNDLASHLAYDHKHKTLSIFHHTTFLKEQLRLTKSHPNTDCAHETLPLGALPRPIILEALDSIQKVIFPLTDPKSRAQLQALVSGSAGFDADALRFESGSLRGRAASSAAGVGGGGGEAEVAYVHFGARLMELFEEVQDPAPQGRIERWLERYSNARYIMAATLVGVVIAVVLGFLGLAVACLQAWIAWQQWKLQAESGNGG